MKLFTKSKQVELTNVEKVQQAKKQTETSLGMFSQINSDLETANATLVKVIEEDTALIEATQLNINSAKAELESNKALQEKIKPFTKEQL